jgi:hypothetical protein
MRAFLAAAWLVEETPNIEALQAAANKADTFTLNRRDQEELWTFVAALLTDKDLVALWVFAGGQPQQRSILLESLQIEGEKRDSKLNRPSGRGNDRPKAAKSSAV